MTFVQPNFLNRLNSINSYWQQFQAFNLLNQNSYQNPYQNYGYNNLDWFKTPLWNSQYLFPTYSANAYKFPSLNNWKRTSIVADIRANATKQTSTPSSLRLPSFGTLTSQTQSSTQLSLNRDNRTSVNGTTSACQNAVRLAEQELSRGVRENGSSNDSIDIRKYKNGAKNNHAWCGYFTSWLYGAGQNSNNSDTFGFTGSTQSIKRDAINAGCYAYKNSGYTPKVGDLAMWTKSASTGHVGIVTEVYADGSFDVIEGNSSNKVAKRHYASQSSVGSGFNGFVKMNEWTA